MPVQACQTNIVNKRCVIINAENFKQDTVLQGSVFPFGHWGNLIRGTVFSCLEVKG